MSCLFCEIIATKKILIEKGEVYLVGENEEALAILDKFPASDGHTLLITKKHFNNISEIDEESWKHLLPLMKEIIGKLEVVFKPAGFNIISNINEIAAQSIFHLHIHVIPKYNKEKGFIWTAHPVLKYSLEQVAEKLK
ncbi:MAG: HIT family protein [Candidatus Moeniiplasma glomeromycotorum]|nr:HIT family protein [Candidatus Moeniiplasma glomeromycotorum]MCE8162163.1 HIT family protein [Candidatus Moeniiplasma glomeromycotorum]MCE8166182.1 HIT family protein [Candidatus Moeniiplasma glomeromycotorum]MCE8166562.1 HIT family protein [Candidatus Moeniiplasma glomeromycotorum]